MTAVMDVIRMEEVCATRMGHLAGYVAAEQGTTAPKDAY
jgi:hypothetical protein